MISVKSCYNNGDTDVGDGDWRKNVLLTSLKCWSPMEDVGDRLNTLKNHKRNEKSRQHNDFVAKILYRSPS